MGGDELCFFRWEQVADVWGGGQSGVIDGEAEVLSGFGEGFGTDHDHVRFFAV